MSSQNSDGLWSKSSEMASRTTAKIDRKTIPSKFDIYQLNLESLKSKLSNTSLRKGKQINSNTIISFPNEEGKLSKYQVVETPIMEDELQKKHLDIKSYIGKGIENPESIVRFSITSLGLHAMFLNDANNTVYIDPYTLDKKSYIVYSKNSVTNVEGFQCLVEESDLKSKKESPKVSAKNNNADDGILRTFRLVIATTGEYSQFHLNNQGISATATDDEKKDAILSAIVTTMTRVNGVFERDVALTMVLVANTKDVIFLDAATDGFSNSDASSLINESQTIIDAAIGLSNYDIGHTFSTGGGGLASLRSPCSTGKARGITGSGSPIGDPYDIDYVAHEMGHQYGANHTFNNSCSNNRNAGTAIEPGSGSTIMGYAGICSPNIQSNSDSYFHLVSVREMWENISAGVSTCGDQTDTGNNAPTIVALENYTVPISTPFGLKAEATDLDGDILSYTWEQLDTEITTNPPVSTSTGGPAFRSVAPTASSTRFFPNIATVIAGNLSNDWEAIPSVARTMKFGVNVRDNNAAVGQSASDETVLTFDANAGPFVMTSQTTDESWDAGVANIVTWDVANTNVAPVNCSNVNILLSIDGGLTFPIVLASNTPNDGSQSIVAPNNTTTNGKIKVESVGNVFYTMNSAKVTIQASEFVMNFDSYDKEVCSPNDGVYTFTYNTFLGFNSETTFSASNLPTGTTAIFNPTSATTDNTSVEMTISNIADGNVGSYSVSVTGTSSVTKTTVVNLNVFSSVLDAPVLSSPANNEVSLLKPYLLTWGANDNDLSYSVEIATDAAFATIVETGAVTNNSYSPLLLQLNTSYFWRVKAINDCGESSFSSVYNFTTANEVCDSIASTDTPLDIPDNNTTGVSSVIAFNLNKIITDVNVTVNITHPWVGDLKLYLISPIGTSVTLAENIGGEGDNYTSTVFDSDATNEISSAIAPFTGVYSPTGNLAVLNNEEALGNWTLKVVDSGNGDLGPINSWSIEVCGVNISGDADGDGVNNSIDLCPDTPTGETVDANGCSDGQLDDDGDGVNNSIDLCLSTPTGSTVNSNGCLILASDNFNIEVVSETCPDKNNGKIIISSNQALNYVTTINGTVYNFTDNVSIEDLGPNVYEFCIAIDIAGETAEQCYSVEVKDGTTVSAKSNVSNKQLDIQIEKGTAPFTVYVNGLESFKSDNYEFSVAIKKGDIVLVKTAVVCEGEYSKSIDLFNDFMAYPNPTKGAFDIVLPVSQKEVVVELYNIHSQLISSKTYSIINGKIQLNIEEKPIGMYIAKVYLDEVIEFKILKN